MAHYFWLENDDEINEWKSKTIGNLYVSTQYFFNNSNIILNQDSNFKNKLLSYLNSEIDIKPTVRTTQRTKNKIKYKKRYKGIDIDAFNSSLRSILIKDSDLLFELYNYDGVFYTSNSKKGFDFAKIDTIYNLINLWNLCFGRKSLYDGENHWNKSLENNDFIKSALESENLNLELFNPGEDVKIEKNSLTILGELQFGNWGLAYRDLFKLLQADANSGVDLFVYVAAHNNLLSYGSDNIVSYDETIKILHEFSNLIKVPIWVIGLDINI